VFVWFTGDARRAIAGSQNAARQLMHNRVGTQHLLLELSARPETVAGLALADLGLTLDGLRGAVIERCAVGAATRAECIPFTPRMWRAVEFAAASPPIQRIGPAELLLALLEDPQSTACQILTDQVGDLSRVRAAVQERLEGAKPASSTELAFGGPVFLSSKRAEGRLLAALDRFTDQARMVDTLSSHMARELMHNRHGTQHLLMGLLARPGELTDSFPATLTGTTTTTTRAAIYPTIAELALDDLGVTLDRARRAVVERCGIGAVIPDGYIESTPSRQRVLESSLTAAESLDHDRIGPEHLLLALLEEPESTGCQILGDQVGDLSRVRGAVAERLGAV
jgi:ATP-dependent Clp protease ATP-binding subunit ClpA